MADWVYTEGCKMPEDQQLPAGTHRYAAIVQYQGADYCGFQKQKHSPSVQQELEQALSYVADSPVAINCAGRTDTAVHASHQVVHFDSMAQRAGHSWVQGANSQLPDSIALIWADQVNKGFHARFSAQSRTYRYIIDNSATRPAILAKTVTWVKHKLDTAAMQRACQHLLGEQDFSAFRGAGCQSNSSFAMRNWFLLFLTACLSTVPAWAQRSCATDSNGLSTRSGSGSPTTPLDRAVISGRRSLQKRGYRSGRWALSSRC